MTFPSATKQFFTVMILGLSTAFGTAYAAEPGAVAPDLAAVRTAGSAAARVAAIREVRKALYSMDEAEIDGDAIVACLSWTLTDEDEAVRKAAVFALGQLYGRIGADAAGRLLHHLEDSGRDVHELTAEIYSLYRPQTVQEVLPLIQPLSQTGLHDLWSKILAYESRRLTALKGLAQSNSIFGALARLYLEEDIEQANRIIIDRIRQEYGAGHWTGHIPQIPIYEMFNPATGTRNKLLSPEAAKVMRDIYWECFLVREGHKPFNSCRTTHNIPEQPWVLVGNMNHDFIFRGSKVFVAKTLKDLPEYASRFDPAQHLGDHARHPELATISLEDYYRRALDFWRERFDFMAGQGVWIEDMVYNQYNIAMTYNFAYHAPDPALRKKARMILDTHWLQYALQTVNGQFGGAKNRAKPHYEGNHYTRGLARFYYGGKSGEMHSTEVALVGEYLPPLLSYQLLAEPEKRGNFIYTERLNQFSGTVGQPPHAYKSSYVTPEYVLGSYIAQNPIEGMRRFGERAFFGINFGQTGAMLRLGPAMPFQYYDAMQHGPILLAKWRGRSTTLKIYLKGYSLTLNELKEWEQDGWYFARLKDAYYALRPATGAFTEVTAGAGADDKDKIFYVLKDDSIPIILHAGGKSEYGSFENFRGQVLDNRVAYENGVVTYTDDQWGELRFNPTPTGELWRSNTLDAWTVHGNPKTLFTKGRVASDGDQQYVLWEEDSNTVMKSPDGGRTWTLSAPGQPGDYSFAGLHDLMYAFGSFPAASGYKCILTSHQIRSEQLKDDVPKVLAATDTTFAAGTANGKIYTGNNWRLNWQHEINPATGADNTIPIREIAGGNGRFVAVGHDGESSILLTFPEDGKTYHRVAGADIAGMDGVLLSDVAYSQSHKVFVVAGAADGITKVFTSTDGKEWTLTKSVNEEFRHLEWAPDVFALVTMPPAPATKARAYTSTDGNAWSPVDLPPTVAGSIARSFSSDGHHFFSVVFESDENLRQVNGKPTYLPEKLFASPYLNSEYNSGLITANFGNGRLVLDFNNNTCRETWKHENVTRIAFADDKVELFKGQKRKLNYTSEPAMIEPDLHWQSADPDIVEVNADGTLTGRGGGTTKITVMRSQDKPERGGLLSFLAGKGKADTNTETDVNDRVAASCTVTVTEGIAFNPQQIDVAKGAKHELTLELYLSDADVDVDWTVADPAIANVETRGRKATITALAQGGTTIQAKAGDYTARCRIRIFDSAGFDVIALTSIAHSPEQNVFVAVGTENGAAKVFTSNDATDWKSVKTITEPFRKLAWAPGGFAIVTAPGGDIAKARVYASADGRDWTVVPLPPAVAGAVGKSFSSDGHRFFTVVESGELYATENLADWAVFSNPQSPLTEAQVLSDNDRRYLLWQGKQIQSTGDGGRSWSKPDTPYSPFADLYDIIYAFGTFPATSAYKDVRINKFARSPGFPSGRPHALAAGAGILAVGMDNGRLFVSKGTWNNPNWGEDEITATDGEAAANKLPIQEIAYGNGRFAAIASDGKNSAILIFPADGGTYRMITEYQKFE